MRGEYDERDAEPEEREVGDPPMTHGPFGEQERERRERGHEQLAVAAGIDEAHEVRAHHEDEPAEQRGQPAESEGPKPQVREDPSQEDVQHDLPAPHHPRIQEEQCERERIEDVAVHAIDERHAAEQERLPERESSRLVYEVRVEIAREVAERVGVGPEQPAPGEEEFAEEDEHGDGVDDGNDPARHIRRGLAGGRAGIGSDSLRTTRRLAAFHDNSSW